jgi:hypothetical protein
MRCTTYEEAKKQAQDNANYMGVPWVAFFDTSGNARCERMTQSHLGVDREVFAPANWTNEPAEADA